MTFADAGRVLDNGQIDAFCQSSAPAAAVTELAETQGVRIVPYTDQQMAQIAETYPFYHPGTMPANMYHGVDEVELPYTTVYWVAHGGAGGDTVQKILEYVYQSEVKERLAEGHRARWSPTSRTSRASARRCTRAPKPTTRSRASGRNPELHLWPDRRPALRRRSATG